MVSVKCDQCGLEFNKFQSNIKKSKHNFCSKRCYSDFKTIKNHRYHFMKSVEIQTDGSWLWKGFVNKRGYGQCGTKYKDRIAHRVSYRLFVGEIPKGMFVCHKNDIKLDVTPSNLWLGTVQDNDRDRDEKGHQCKGSSHGNSKLTEYDVIEIRNLWSTGKYTHKEISEKFNTKKENIGIIVRGITWKHILPK